MYQLGFTPEQEASILKTSERTRDFIEAQEQVRTLMIAGTVAGFLYTLARFGELAMQVRRQRREASP